MPCPSKHGLKYGPGHVARHAEILARHDPRVRVVPAWPKIFCACHVSDRAKRWCHNPSSNGTAQVPALPHPLLHQLRRPTPVPPLLPQLRWAYKRGVWGEVGRPGGGDSGRRFGALAAVEAAGPGRGEGVAAVSRSWRRKQGRERGEGKRTRPTELWRDPTAPRRKQ